MPHVVPNSFDLAGGFAVLRSTPAALSALLITLPDAWLDSNEGPGTWSPRQVVQHLIWGEVDDWVPRVQLLLEHGEHQAFRPFDREEGFRRYAGLAIGDLLSEFARLRKESLESLERLQVSSADLQRRGRHPDFGVVTLEQLLATWVTHDLTHLTQVARVLTKHSGAATGPWRAYFSLLQ